MRKLIAFTASVVFLALALYGYGSGVEEYIFDSFLFVVLTWVLFFLYHRLFLNKFSYSLILFSFFLHDAGVFGWYAHSPIFLQWDHVTHFVGSFAVSFSVLHFFKQYWTESKVQNSILVVLTLLVALGVGAFVEQLEYIGYLNLGEGEGLFYYGGLGDVGVNLREMDAIGGGWLNTMIDLMYNFYGAVAGLIASLFFLQKISTKTFKSP